MDVCDAGVGGPWGYHASMPFPDALSYEDQQPQPTPDQSQAIQQLYALFPTRPDVAFLRTDDTFLLRFLRARKFRVADAFLLLCHYFEYRQRHRDLFRGLTVGGGSEGQTALQSALLDGLPGVLAQRDPRGRPILILLAANWDHGKYDARTVYQAVMLTLERLVEEEAVQAAGVVAILDWSNFPTRLTTSLSPKFLRMVLDGLQDAFPLRLGALHLVNQPWYVEAALGLARPFLKDKLRSRVHVHGNNLANLHAHVPPRLLPAELGGEGGEYHAHTWATTMLEGHHTRPATTHLTTTVTTTPHTTTTTTTNNLTTLKSGLSSTSSQQAKRPQLTKSVTLFDTSCSPPASPVKPAPSSTSLDTFPDHSEPDLSTTALTHEPDTGETSSLTQQTAGAANTTPDAGSSTLPAPEAPSQSTPLVSSSDKSPASSNATVGLSFLH